MMDSDEESYTIRQRVPAPPFVDDDSKTVKGRRSMLDDENDSDKEEEKDWW